MAEIQRKDPGIVTDEIGYLLAGWDVVESYQSRVTSCSEERAAGGEGNGADGLDKS